MRKCVILFILFSMTCYASNLRVVLKNGTPVVTNISKSVFFFNAFKYSKLKKQRVLDMIRSLAKKYGVNVNLAKAIAKIESDYDPKSISKSGAKGVMQLMDKTAKSYGVENPFNVKDNIKGGILFLKHLIKKYHNVKLIAAAYNAGESAVDKYKGIPPFSETERYVKKFLSVYNGSMYISLNSNSRKRENNIVKVGNVFTNIKANLW